MGKYRWLNIGIIMVFVGIFGVVGTAPSWGFWLVLLLLGLSIVHTELIS